MSVPQFLYSAVDDRERRTGGDVPPRTSPKTLHELLPARHFNDQSMPPSSAAPRTPRTEPIANCCRSVERRSHRGLKRWLAEIDSESRACASQKVYFRLARASHKSICGLCIVNHDTIKNTQVFWEWVRFLRNVHAGCKLPPNFYTRLENLEN
ncbi:hypothetical protein B0H17DRAFT_1179916 [Mycena rosella]|uniref:Uncharacterized protein n=1 Tax=Mycena rosella TaxID=1033263 RepID=A0AAD7DHG8_MYCRO|nr:hypothetical protein B0H17DRAFT_1179916 [Mycena rosella]